MQTIDISRVSTLVPPTRLGQLLRAERSSKGIELEELEAAADGRFSLQDLMLLESASVAVSDDDIREAAKLYGLELDGHIRGRTQLLIDLNEGKLLIGDEKGKFKRNDDDEQIMLRYLALVYRMRNLPPGKPITPRVDDLDVLAHVFGSSPEEIRLMLQELMVSGVRDIESSQWALKRKYLMPAMGILVALTSAGGLVLVNSNSVAAQNMASAGRTSGHYAPALQRSPASSSTKKLIVPVGHIASIGEALTLERPATSAQLATLGHTANIGAALTLERDTTESTHPAALGHIANIGDALSLERA